MTFAIETMVKRWKVVCVLPLAYLLRHEGSTRIAVILVSLSSLLFSVALSLGLSSGITKNIKALERSMRSIETGDFNIRIEPHSLDEVGLLGLRFNLMANKIDELVNSVYRERLAKKEMEFKALQAQINPHFLYNTLGSIKWLARKNGGDSVETMISTLIKLLRFSVSIRIHLGGGGARVRFHYLLLQKLRYEDRFSFEFGGTNRPRG
jgi:sensor histidine kinase YesM